MQTIPLAMLHVPVVERIKVELEKDSGFNREDFSEMIKSLVRLESVKLENHQK